MERVAVFEKVSEKEFGGSTAMIELPVRATAGSAGYDIKTPVQIRLEPGQSVRIATGLRCRMAQGWVMFIMPKSGLGFKYRVQLDNTIGVVDQDYYNADNEGHIQVQITNDNRDGKVMELPAGKAFCQALFLPFGITEDDAADGQRHGGMGSTNA